MSSAVFICPPLVSFSREPPPRGGFAYVVGDDALPPAPTGKGAGAKGGLGE